MLEFNAACPCETDFFYKYVGGGGGANLGLDRSDVQHRSPLQRTPWWRGFTGDERNDTPPPPLKFAITVRLRVGKRRAQSKRYTERRSDVVARSVKS